MTTADLLELAEHHAEQAQFNQRLADFMRVPSVTTKHDERAAWHARHATNLKTLADTFTTHFPETITGK